MTKDIGSVRNRSEAALTASFCLLFHLQRSEGQLLAWLATHDYLPEARDGQADKSRTTAVKIGTLRRKLKPHKIEIITIHRLGYTLAVDARHRLRILLNKYDVQFVAIKRTRKPRATRPDHSKAPQLNLFEPDASTP